MRACITVLLCVQCASSFTAACAHVMSCGFTYRQRLRYAEFSTGMFRTERFPLATIGYTCVPFAEQDNVYCSAYSLQSMLDRNVSVATSRTKITSELQNPTALAADLLITVFLSVLLRGQQSGIPKYIVLSRTPFGFLDLFLTAERVLSLQNLRCTQYDEESPRCMYTLRRS